MTDDIEYSDDTLTVDADGHADGTAYILGVDGYDVSVSVTSYDYEHHGEARTNHVVLATVTEPDGAIVAEPEGRDYDDVERAIESARNLGRHVAENIGDYV